MQNSDRCLRFFDVCNHRICCWITAICFVMSLLLVCWALCAVVVCWNIYQNIMSTLLQLLGGILHGSILICIGCALFFLWVTYQFRLNGTFCLCIIHYRYHTDDTHGVVCVEVYRLHTAYVFCWFLLPILILFCCLDCLSWFISFVYFWKIECFIRVLLPSQFPCHVVVLMF